MAARLQWMPDTLQNSAISAVVTSYKRHKKDIRSLPNNLLMGVLHKLYRQNMLDQLAPELIDLDVILRLLSCKGTRVSLHQMFQGRAFSQRCGYRISIRWYFRRLVRNAFVTNAKSVGKSSFSDTCIHEKEKLSIFWSIHSSIRHFVCHYVKTAKSIARSSEINCKSKAQFNGDKEHP